MAHAHCVDLEHKFLLVKREYDEAFRVQQRKYSHMLELVLAQLRGIEKALFSRIALVRFLKKEKTLQDAECRRMKAAWLAVQNLDEAIRYGKRGACCIEGRRLPLGQQLDSIRRFFKGDSFAVVLAAAMPRTARVKGVYTADDLVTRFRKVYRVAGRVSRIGESGGGPLRFLGSWLFDLVHLSLPKNFAKFNTFDPLSLGVHDILDRARYHVDRGEFVAAARLLRLLKFFFLKYRILRGEPARVARDWIRDATEHEEAKLLARLLTIHSAATSIRAIY